MSVSFRARIVGISVAPGATEIPTSVAPHRITARVCASWRELPNAGNRAATCQGLRLSSRPGSRRSQPAKPGWVGVHCEELIVDRNMRSHRITLACSDREFRIRLFDREDHVILDRVLPIDIGERVFG